MQTKLNLQRLTPFLACFAAALFSFYDLFELAIFNRLNINIQTQYHITPQLLGTLSSSFLWANALALIPVGLLLDKGLVRLTACFLLGLSTLSNVIFIYSHSLPLAFMARFIQGLASAGSLLTCMRLAINWYKEKANTAIGWMIAFALSGGVFANFATSWAIPFFLGLGVLIIAVYFLYDVPAQVLIPSQPTQFWIKPKNFLMGGYLGLINFPVFILGSLWGNAFLAHQTSLTMSERSFISALIFVGIIVGSPLWGYLASQYLNPKKILAGGCIGLIFLSVLLYAIPSHFFVISLIFFGFGFFSCTQNTAYYVLSQINTPTSLSRGTATASVVFNSLGALSQIIFYFAPQLLLYPFIALILLLLTLN